MSDLNLSLQEFRDGDPSSFNNIYQTFYGRIYYFVSNFIKNQMEAQDITLDTFVKLWRLRANYESIENIKGFLYLTARNACIDYFRGKQKRREMEDHMLYLLQDEDSTKGLIITEEILAALYDKLQSLPRQPREILTMLLEGLSISAIAEKLGIPKHQVSVQKEIGIRKIRNDWRNL